MRAIAIDSFGEPEGLTLREVPRPRPGRGELLLRVVAAGVQPLDARIRRGELSEQIPHAFPLIPGWDVAGVVEEFGDGASRFRKGDRIWACARKPLVQWGCYADYVTVDEANCALMPSKMLYEEAAAVPLPGLSAYQCLFGRPGIGSGSRVLIHGASGAIGHLALQLARNVGAEVYGSAPVATHDLLYGLGVAAAIDATREPLATAAARLAPDGFDLLLDTAGDAEPGSEPILRAGGRWVSTVRQPDPSTLPSGIAAHFVFVEPNAEQLGLLAQMVDRKQLRCHVDRILSLPDAAEAHRMLEQEELRGALVLNL